MFCLWNLWDFLYIGNVICEHGFTSSFPVWMLFISFSCLIALVINFSSEMAKAGIIALFLMLEEKPSDFQTLMIFAMGFAFMVFFFYHVEVVSICS